MDPNGVIKGFNILKYKPVGMFEVNDIKSVKPFSILRKIFIFVLVGIANAIDTQIIPNNPAIRSAVILFYLTDEGMKCLKNAVAAGIPVPEKSKKFFMKMEKKISF